MLSVFGEIVVIIFFQIINYVEIQDVLCSKRFLYGAMCIVKLINHGSPGSVGLNSIFFDTPSVWT